MLNILSNYYCPITIILIIIGLHIMEQLVFRYQYHFTMLIRNYDNR